MSLITGENMFGLIQCSNPVLKINSPSSHHPFFSDPMTQFELVDMQLERDVENMRTHQALVCLDPDELSPPRSFRGLWRRIRELWKVRSSPVLILARCRSHEHLRILKLFRWIHQRRSGIRFGISSCWNDIMKICSSLLFRVSQESTKVCDQYCYMDFKLMQSCWLWKKTEKTNLDHWSVEVFVVH